MNTLQQLRWLWGNYTEAWIFWGVHLIIAITLALDLRRVAKEIRGCNEWVPHTPHFGQKTESELVEQLQLFIKESAHWAELGARVPMTDFSDRIDSIIEGLADELHNKVNLFLVVGIAGTFFGMVLFAGDPRGLQSTSEIYKSLINALAHAFPIGFFGLVWTVAGHYIVGNSEDRLRQAAARATNRTIEYRFKKEDDTAKSPVTLLYAAIDAIPSQMSSALQPLENLEITLAKTLTPVIDAFKEGWATTAQDMRDSLRAMSTSIVGLQESIAKLERPIGEMSETFGQITETTQVLQKIATDAATQARLASEAVIKLDRSLADGATAIDKAAVRVSELPEVIRDQTAAAFSNVAAACRPAWEELSKEFVGSLTNASANTLNDIKTATLESCTEIKKAGELLNQISATLGQALKEAIEGAIDTISKPVTDLDSVFRTEYPKVIDKLQPVLQDAGRNLSALRQTLDDMNSSNAKTTMILQAWTQLGSTIQDANRSIRGSADRLSSMLNDLSVFDDYLISIRVPKRRHKASSKSA
jgi:chromosome segregation ATPase